MPVIPLLFLAALQDETTITGILERLEKTPSLWSIGNRKVIGDQTLLGPHQGKWVRARCLPAVASCAEAHFTKVSHNGGHPVLRVVSIQSAGDPDAYRPRIRRLVDDLGSNNAAKRAAAAEQLREMGPGILDPLQEELDEMKRHETYATPETLARMNQWRERIRSIMEEVAGEMVTELRRYLRDLDADDFDVREKATKRIIAIGRTAPGFVRSRVQEHLKKAREESRFEAESRCKEILEALKPEEPWEKEVRDLAAKVGSDPPGLQAYRRLYRRITELVRAGTDRKRLVKILQDAQGRAKDRSSRSLLGNLVRIVQKTR